MSALQIQSQTEGIQARLERLLNAKVPFAHYRVGALLDAAWHVGRALEAQQTAHPYALWEGILAAYGER